MTMSFNLSAHAIMQEIYAASALRCIDSGKNAKSLPPILSRDNSAALLLLVKDAFAFVVMKFIAHVEACNLNDETPSYSNDTNNSDEMILSVDIRMGSYIPASVAGAMRVALEHAIAAYALHISYIGHDDETSHAYLSIANDEVESFRQSISMRQFNTPTITPRY